MEKLNLPVFIPCSVHASEVIQRIDLNPYARKQIYCLECALQNENPKILFTTLETLPNFLNMAGLFYENTKSKLSITNGPPPQYLEVMAKQSEAFKGFADHIAKEKEKIEDVFEDIVANVIQKIDQKKKELLESLDLQLANISSQYNSFTKQMMKAYPRAQDIALLYPSREQLEQTVSTFKTPTELEHFVRSIKEDISQGKLAQNFNELDESSKKTYFDKLVRKLKEYETSKPLVDIGNIDMAKIRVALQDTLDRLLNKNISLKAPIMEGSLTQTYLESNIVHPEDIALIKDWMPSLYQFNLRLLYRSSRDGANPQAFHAKCDGKGATLTIIKCMFEKSQKTSIIGGFLDQSWHHRGDYIISDYAFLFSLTTGVKCPVSNRLYAAYGGPRNGPRFGNCDLQVYSSKDGYFDQTLIRPGTFSFAAKLVDANNYKGSGEIAFKIVDMEVFHVS